MNLNQLKTLHAQAKVETPRNEAKVKGLEALIKATEEAAQRGTNSSNEENARSTEGKSVSDEEGKERLAAAEKAVHEKDRSVKARSI